MSMQSTGTESGASFTAGGLPCPQCGAPLPPRALMCPACNGFIFRERLQQLAIEAAKQEWIDPIKASFIWRQCLGLLPMDSPQYREVAQRAVSLAGGAVPMLGAVPGQMELPPDEAPPYRAHAGRTRPRESWPRVLLKTGGSMALSMAIYHQNAPFPTAGERWAFSIAFVLLIMLHEMGHVIANWYFRIVQSSPLFIPYVGALIVLRQNPPSARAEAVMGIAGPIAGAIGTLICYLWFTQTGSQLALNLAECGAFMNLFNMIPCPPMDGGRVAAAISPLLWIPGALTFAAFIFRLVWANGNVTGYLVGGLIFWSAIQRIRAELFTGGWRRNYYRVDVITRIAMSLAALGLVAVLLYITWGLRVNLWTILGPQDTHPR